MSYQIINKNDIYIFFEVIENLEACTVLDIGMFLKRMAAVSRSIDNKRISEDVILYGVDIPDTPSFPVYKTIYNKILPKEEIESALRERQWEVTTMLKLGEVLSPTEIENIFSLCKEKTKYILLDNGAYKIIEKSAKYKYLRDVSLDDDKYYILSF